MNTHLLRLLITLASLLLLAGCGGGGGGSSTTGSGSSDLTACLNYKAPASPKLAYSGKTIAATLDEKSAQPLVADLFQTVNSISFITFYDSDELVQEDTCIVGGSGQTKILDYYRAGSGVGWEAAQYNDYSFELQAAQLTGLAYATFATGSDGTLHETMWLEQLRVVTDTGDDITFDGTLTFPLQNSANAYNWVSPLTVNLIAKNNRTGTQVWLKDFTFKYSFELRSDTEGGDITQETIGGQIYDSSWGYANISTPEDLVSPGYVQLPGNLMSSGSVKFSNSGHSVLYAEQLNFLRFAYMLDLDGDGVIDESARGSWSTLSYDSTPWPSLNGAVPIAVINSVPKIGVKADFDSLGSYDPSGNFITSTWKLLYAPPGSIATLSVVPTPTPAFVPDVPGDYKIQLTTSDGAGSNIQNFVMTVTDSSGRDESSLLGNSPVANALGPTQQAHVGDTVIVDGTASRGNLGPHWSLIAPPGSHAALVSSDTNGFQFVRESFVPDVSGYYVAEYGDTFEIIAVDTGMDFDTPVAVNYGTANQAVAFAVGDFNNDGIMDVAALVGDISSAHVQIYYGTATGGFSSPVTLSDPSIAGGRNLVIADINNDGLTDLIVETSNGAPFVYFQNPDGTISAPQSVATTSGSSCAMSGNVYFLAAGGWDGHAGNSLFTYDSCIPASTTINVLGYSSGQFSLSGSYPFSLFDPFNEMVAADLTGDGLDDLIFGDPATTPTITVYAGQADGSFSLLASYSLSHFGSGAQFFTINDLSNDGKLDVAALDGSKIDLFPNNGSLGLSTPVPYGLSGISSSFYPVSISSGDINSDGRTDLLVGYKEPGSSPMFIGLKLQSSSSTFDSELRFPIGVDTSGYGGPGASTIVTTDMNNDGLTDVIMLVGGTIEILYQKN